MITLFIAIFALPFILLTSAEDASHVRYSSLLSAQCKALCLHEYRNQHRSSASPFNHGKTKRLLTGNALTLPWRSIWERCPRLLTCSSCLLPCDLDPPLLLSNEQSCQAICSTLENGECQRSCTFIRDLYQQQSICSTDECQSSSSCSPSSDCFGKVPQAYNVTAMERKSRRTVKLKWTSSGLNHAEPVFYVIEAQWKLPRTNVNEQEIVSKWGFVKEEVSHTKAIIRNIQRDNRWYTFRVAAVTRHGHSPFSITTKPFRLSSNSRNQSEKSSATLDPPGNFSIKDYHLNSNSINVTLIWQEASLPINGYQISWQAENDPSSLVNTIDVSSLAYPLELTIPFLSMYTTYVFKIRSFILPDGAETQMSQPTSIKFNYEEEFFSVKHFDMSEPYFINGLIKMNISWRKSNDRRVQQYDLHWIETQCYSDVLSCCYRRDAVTVENSFQLYDLRFNCTYLLNIKPVVSKLRIKKSFQVHFNVTSCHSIEVHGTTHLACQPEPSTRPASSSSSLTPFNLIVTKNQSGIDFSWENTRALVNGASVYQLRIEQLPSRLELISVDLSPRITNYFLPASSRLYPQQQTDRYLNVTLNLYENFILQEQQSVLIEEYPNEPILKHSIPLNIVSSTRSIRPDCFLLLILFMSLDLPRR